MARYIDAEKFSKNLAMEVYLTDDEVFTKEFEKFMSIVKKQKMKHQQLMSKKLFMPSGFHLQT